MTFARTRNATFVVVEKVPQNAEGLKQVKIAQNQRAGKSNGPRAPGSDNFVDLIPAAGKI